MFLVFSNDVFHVFQYEFTDPSYYNSIQLKQHKAYTFADGEISLSEIIQLWKSIVPKDEPTVTFPQADSFERVVDLLSVLYETGLTRDEVTLKYEFDPRQTNYYISACEYLGLLDRATNVDGEREYRLSAEARSIMAMRYKPKHLALIKKILECPVFYKSFEIAIKTGVVPDKNEVYKVMSNSNLRINDVIINRRSSTVRSWLDWFSEFQNKECKRMDVCIHCREPLNESQYRQNREYKSCPKCSAEDGNEHVYYPYPSYFGTTPLRATPNTPDGAQSYCTRCRGGDTGPFDNGKKCSEF